MKYIIIILTLLGLTASARIGETLEQLEKRYGEPVSAKIKKDAFNVVSIIEITYVFNRVTIAVSFFWE